MPNWPGAVLSSVNCGWVERLLRIFAGDDDVKARGQHIGFIGQAQALDIAGDLAERRDDRVPRFRERGGVNLSAHGGRREFGLKIRHQRLQVGILDRQVGKQRIGFEADQQQDEKTVELVVGERRKIQCDTDCVLFHSYIFPFLQKTTGRATRFRLLKPDETKAVLMPTSIKHELTSGAHCLARLPGWLAPPPPKERALFPPGPSPKQKDFVPAQKGFVTTHDCFAATHCWV